MRLFEMLVILTNFLAFIIFSFPQFSVVRQTGYISIILLPMIAQLLFEESRWQMVPAYMLSALFFLLWLLNRIVTTPMVPHRFFINLAIVLGIIVFTISVTLPFLFPVFRFPQPSGPYQIGTMTYHWVDTNRQEFFSTNPQARREVMAQIWYPAKTDPSAPHTYYLQHPEVLAATLRILHLPTFLFEHFKYVPTHAILSAPLAEDKASYPVLIFLSGRGGYRQSNTFQIEELVSHGYIVVGIDQPYAASGVVFPDGRLIAMDSRMYNPKNVGHDPFTDLAVPFLAQDVTFTLDQLTLLDKTDSGDILSGRMDLQHVGIFGVSLGGIVTGEACRLDSRLQACLVMDAFMSASVVQAGLQQPAMWISRDAQTMELEGWAESDIDETQSTMRAVYATLPGPGYLVLIPGLFHPDFTDAPLFSPLASQMGLSGRIPAERAHHIINVYSLAFFDQHLKEVPSDLLAGPVKEYPEVLFETRQP
ncbi:MAG: carboxylic ester hydrolase [Anaerolineales bacterium]|nr:carboxylic ester hydrolase [Anaerolineales bacterium]